jgi:hypothetical protein
VAALSEKSMLLKMILTIIFAVGLSECSWSALVFPQFISTQKIVLDVWISLTEQQK